MNYISKYNLKLFYGLIGCTAVITQVIYIREYMTVFYGNELSIGIVLAIWLFWTAIGSIASNILIKPIHTYYKIISLVLLCLALFIPFTLVLIRLSRILFETVRGETLGLAPIIFSSILMLAPVCLLLGGLFVLASKSHSDDYVHATGIVYKYEALGSAAAGMILSYLLLEWLNSFQILFVISSFNLLMILLMNWKIIVIKWRIVNVILIILLILLFPYFAGQLQNYTNTRLWAEFNLLETKHSPYGNLAVIEVDGEHSLFENGIKSASSDDISGNEEIVHYALLEHKNPQTVLLIGGGISGVINEMLKYPSVQTIDYAELNPAKVQLAEMYFSENWQKIEEDHRVNIHLIDGRKFVKHVEEKYDVVIINAGDPVNANINRFYTAEFFSEINLILNNSGIFTFQVSGSENYLSDQLLKFLKIVNNTLKSEFKEVKILPGDNIHFFASAQKGIVSLDADLLIRRMKGRNINNHYVNEHYINFKLMPDRIQDLKLQLIQQQDTFINKDFQPVAYFFNITFWSSQFSTFFNTWFKYMQNISFEIFLLVIVCLFLLFVSIVYFVRGKNMRVKLVSESGVFIMGFSLIAFELMILLGFQAIFGYIYHQMALLIGIFMAGMAAGSGVSLFYIKQNDIYLKKHLMAIHFCLAIMPVLLIIFLNQGSLIMKNVDEILLSQFIFPALAFVSGGIGGYQFPVASKIYFSKINKTQNIGILYGLDILGAMAGTILLSTIIIPLFGFFKVVIFISLINCLFIIVSLLTRKSFC